MNSEQLEKLQAPMQPSEIEWKIQSIRNGKTLVVPYLTNRSIIKRLNEHVGFCNWKNRLIPVTFQTAKGTENGFISEVSVRCGDEWITRQDTAPLTDIEPLKGGASDAMKRVAVQFGIGLDLYEYPKVYVDGEHKFLPDWAFKLLDRLAAAFIAGKIDRDMYYLKESQQR